MHVLVHQMLGKGQCKRYAKHGLTFCRPILQQMMHLCSRSNGWAFEQRAKCRLLKRLGRRRLKGTQCSKLLEGPHFWAVSG